MAPSSVKQSATGSSEGVGLESRSAVSARRARVVSLSPGREAGTERTIAQLDKWLAPEWVSRRQGAGDKQYSYLTGPDAIYIANKIFGNDGWSSRIVEMKREIRQEGSKWVVDAECHVCVTVHWGRLSPGAYDTSHEAIGYGGGKPMPRRGDAVEGATKEAETDALKRALRKFGQATGNCLYEKLYLVFLEAQRKQEGKTKDGSTLWVGNQLRKYPATVDSEQALLPYTAIGPEKAPVMIDGHELEDDFFVDDDGFEL